MNRGRSAEYFVSLVHELRRLPRETEWVEFKENHAESREVSEYISALANAAALVGKAFGYLVWGVRNDNHAVVGTTVDLLGIPDRNAADASRLLKEAAEAGVIVVLDPTAGHRSRTYVPFWAGSAQSSSVVV